MVKRTRYFFIGSALVVVLGLCTGLVAYYNGALPLFRSRVGPSDLAYIPADATGVAYANVRDIMNSEFHQKLRQILPSSQGKDELLSETGIDLEHDVTSVVAAVGVGAPTEHGLVLVRGTFDEGRIETLMRQHNGTVEDYKGKRLLLAAKTPPATDALCLTFPEAGLALFGDAAEVKQAIDTHLSHQDVTSNAALMKFVGQLDGVGNTAWAIGGMDAVAKSANVPQQVKDQLPGVQWLSVSVRVGTGVSGVFHAEARDAKAADDLRAVVNGAIAAGRLMGGKDPKIDALLNSLQITGTGTEVDLAFTVPPEMLDIMNTAGALKGLSK